MRPLPFADGADEIDEANGHIPGSPDVFQLKAIIRVDGRELLEGLSCDTILQGTIVYAFDI